MEVATYYVGLCMPSKDVNRPFRYDVTIPIAPQTKNFGGETKQSIGYLTTRGNTTTECNAPFAHFNINHFLIIQTIFMSLYFVRNMNRQLNELDLRRTADFFLLYQK